MGWIWEGLKDYFRMLGKLFGGAIEEGMKTNEEMGKVKRKWDKEDSKFMGDLI